MMYEGKTSAVEEREKKYVSRETTAVPDEICADLLFLMEGASMKLGASLDLRNVTMTMRQQTGGTQRETHPCLGYADDRNQIAQRLDEVGSRQGVARVQQRRLSPGLDV